MNIFFLSKNPKEAAIYHCDKHVVKMIVETAQLLYAAHWILGTSREDLPENAYKLTHKNHPCSVWARDSLTNYLWLCSLGWWLCKEYTFRYGKTHKTEAHILWLFKNTPKQIPYHLTMTEPAQAMPDEYKENDPIEAYRKFYIESKFKNRGIVTYKMRELPPFLQGM
jgi:hypothetical protein